MHAHYHTGGTGHLYQGRFKSFPVQDDEHLLTVMRYVAGGSRGSVAVELGGRPAVEETKEGQGKRRDKPVWSSE